MDSQIILNIITALLAIATVWLAIATQSMVRETKRSVNLEATPYLSFSELKIIIAKPIQNIRGSELRTAVRLGIVFLNPGKVRIEYQISNIRMTLDSRTIENPKFDSKGGYIFPGQTKIFWYGTLPFQGDIQFPSKGIAEFEVSYWGGNENQKATLSQKLNYSILSLEPPYYEWVNTYENYSA